MTDLRTEAEQRQRQTLDQIEALNEHRVDEAFASGLLYGFITGVVAVIVIALIA